ncbi:MAG: hypothetical protein ACI95C_000816 [Pseudohongiellaceae bacterium]|jgi:hypothetical protein
MISQLTRAHLLAKKVTKWFSVLLGIASVLCWVLLLLGNMEIDLELDGGIGLNAFLVVGLVAGLLALVMYGISFSIIYGAVFIASKIHSQ